MSIVIACGAECGIVTLGSAAAANRHWSTLAGTPAIETSVVRSGARSFSFPAAATLPYFQRTCASTRTVGYFRAYFRLTDATPASGPMYLMLAVMPVGGNHALSVDTGGVLGVGFPSPVQTGPTLANDTWYGVEMEMDVSANPHTIRWRTWDASGGWVSRTNATTAAAAETGITSIRFGRPTGGPTSALTTYMDDVLVGEAATTGEDYDTATSKGGKVLRYLPTADGAHAFTTNDFEYNDTTGIASSATDIYTYLDDSDQSSIADGFISQNVAGAGKLIAVTFADEPTETVPRAVAVTSTHHSAGTGANEMHLRVSDDGTNWTNVWGDWSAAGVDTSDTTAHFLHKVLTTKPSSGAWTQAAVNSMRAQWGNSDDVSAIPYLDSVSLEVEWTEVAASALTDPMGAMGFFGV